MKLDTVVITGLLPARAARVYGAWLDEREHRSFTGGQDIELESRVGGRIQSAPYRGKIVKLRNGAKLGFTLRTPEFPDEQPDSRVEIDLEDRDDGTCTIRIEHSQLPGALVPLMESLWLDRYLTPMRMYFAQLPELPTVPAPGAAASKAKVEATKTESKSAPSPRRSPSTKSPPSKRSPRSARAAGKTPTAAKPIPSKKAAAAAKKATKKKIRTRSA